ncbi:MAG: biopolymer transporter ExbD [Bacteroidetes bacterium]|nr:MAG: biopolymer transporter ExbD [Bacteroidota bacterium]
MAEMNTTSGRAKRTPGVKKNKKLSPRLDLTPMVDLGFLLITFFVFTTAMTRPATMKLYLPKDDPDSTKVPAPGALTIILGQNNRIFYYEGDDATKFKGTNFTGIRDIIVDKKRRTDARQFVVIIKPSQDASYKNTVNVLDEMKIDDVKRFAMVDITSGEYKLIQSASN